MTVHFALPLVMLAATSGAANAQSPHLVVVDGKVHDRSNEASTTRYVAERRADYEARTARLDGRDLGPELQRLRTYVRKRMKQVPGQPEITDATKAALNEIWADQLAARIAEFGWTMAEAEALEKHGYQLATLFDLGLPGPSLLANAAHSEDVIVGEIASVQAEDIGDGRRTSVHFRTVETLAGMMKPGESVAIRLYAGCDPSPYPCPPVAGEPGLHDLKSGDRYLLFVSRAALAEKLRERGAPPTTRRDVAFNMSELIRVDGERLLPTHTYSGGTIASARAELVPFGKARAEVKAPRAQP